MEDTKQVVEGGSLLQALADMFFKGLNNLLNSAAEYQEEMGVLKQINKIEIETEDGKQKYTLTIKLSPIKNKSNYYFVEAETDAPNLDVSGINQKVIELDKKNSKQFNDMIDKLISNAGYETNDLNRDLDEDAEEVPEEEKEEGSLQLEADVTELLQKAEDEFNVEHPRMTSSKSAGLGIIQIEIQLDPSEDFTSALAVITGMGAMDTAGTVVVDSNEFEVPTVDKDGNVRDANEFIGEVSQCVVDYCTENGLKSPSKGYANTAASIQVTLLKEKDGVSYTAINCSTDVKAAIGVIEQIADDPEFLEILTVGQEKSFEILDEGEDFDINEIEEVDTSSTYIELFKMSSMLQSKMIAYKWLVGEREWTANASMYDFTWDIDGFVNNTALWVIKHTDMKPVPISEFSDLTKFGPLTNEDGTANVDAVKDEIASAINVFLGLLDIYYVNLEHEEQAVADSFIDSVERQLAYI